MGTQTPIYNIYVYIYTEWHNVAYQHRMMKCPILHIYTHLMVYTAQMEIHKATHTHTHMHTHRKKEDEKHLFTANCPQLLLLPK